MEMNEDTKAVLWETALREVTGGLAHGPEAQRQWMGLEQWALQSGRDASLPISTRLGVGRAAWRGGRV